MAVSFSELHTADGLKALEAHLAGKTYISGFPGKASGVNLSAAGSSSAPAEASKDAEDDDDLDLFGDETEDDKKAAEERAAAKPAKNKENPWNPWNHLLTVAVTRGRVPKASKQAHVPMADVPMAEETNVGEYYTEEEKVGGPGSGGEEDEEEGAGKKRKRALGKSLDGFSKRGVCYLSRVPPHMNPSHVRQMFSKYGEVQRIYFVPEGEGHRKHSNVRAKAYSEGWIEFAKKSVAKRVANLLNGEQIGGKKRSSFYYDIWNVKYLRKFKWDDLVGEIAQKTHIREQKLNLEITAAKKQRDHYLSNAEKSRTQKIIRERIKKRQKTEGKESNGVHESKIDRPIPQQTRPVEERGPKTKPKLSKNILAGVFGGSSS